MIEMIGFLALPFLASILILLVLGYLGMHVVDREIIFIDIALAQIAALGATFAHVIFQIGEGSLWSYVFAFGCTIAAALFLAIADRRITQITHEAIIGVLYAISSAAALFILATSAGGETHMEHMLAGNILWVTWPDIILAGSVFLAVGIFHFIFRKKFIHLSETIREESTREKGATERGALKWNFLFYVSMGLVITVAVNIAGVLVIFSFLIIPAVFALVFTTSWLGRLMYAWAAGLAAIILGLLVSYTFDYSCSPSIISFLGLFLIAAGVYRRIRPKQPV